MSLDSNVKPLNYSQAFEQVFLDENGSKLGLGMVAGGMRTVYGATSGLVNVAKATLAAAGSLVPSTKVRHYCEGVETRAGLMKARDQVVRGLVETAGLGVAFTPYDEMRADFRKQRASHREQEEKLGKELGDARVQLEKTGKDWEEKLALANKGWKEKLDQAQVTIEHLKTGKLEADGQLTAKADELQKQQQQISDLQQQLRKLEGEKKDAEDQNSVRQVLIEQLKPKVKAYDLKALRDNPAFDQFLVEKTVTSGG